MATITIGSATDLGKRESNEDSVLAVVAQAPSAANLGDQPSGASALLILADGMGGRAHGQLASQTAVKATYRELAHILAMRAGTDAAYLETSLQNALRQANARIKEIATGDAATDGMGTTCTVAIIACGLISLAHVGDTRAYLVTGEGVEFGDAGEIELLTQDHSVVAGEVRAGRLTEEQARRSKFRNVITRAVGVEDNVTPDILTIPVAGGAVSYLVISSDGLHGTADTAEIERIVRRYPRSPQDAADALVVAAKSAGASDNISVIVARVDATADQEIPETMTAPAAAPAVERRRPKRGRRRHLFGNVVAFILGVVLAGIIAWLAIPGGGNYHPAPVGNPAPVTPQPSPPPADLSAATYAAPQPLLGRLVAGTVILPAQGDLLVVAPTKHQVLRVRTTDGQVLTAVPDAANLASTPSRSSYWAADSQGNLYQSISSPPSLRKYDRDGKFLRTIGQGVLTRPAAMAIASSGDIFVIDNNTLKRIPALAAVPAASGGLTPPSTAPAAATGTPASSSQPTSSSDKTSNT